MEKSRTHQLAGPVSVALLVATALRYSSETSATQHQGLPGGLRLLSTAPHLALADDVLSAEEIESLVSGAPPMVRCQGNWKAGRYNDTRLCGVMPVGDNKVLQRIRQMLGKLLDADVSGLTHLPVRRSLPGTPAIPVHNEFMSLEQGGGHPDAIALIYLQNGAPEGTGRLVFPRSKISIEPQPGALVFFKVKNDWTGQMCPYHAHSVDEYPAEATSDRLVITVSLVKPAGSQARGSRLQAKPLFSGGLTFDIQPSGGTKVDYGASTASEKILDGDDEHYVAMENGLAQDEHFTGVSDGHTISFSSKMAAQHKGVMPGEPHARLELGHRLQRDAGVAARADMRECDSGGAARWTPALVVAAQAQPAANQPGGALAARAGLTLVQVYASMDSLGANLLGESGPEGEQ